MDKNSKEYKKAKLTADRIYGQNTSAYKSMAIVKYYKMKTHRNYNVLFVFVSLYFGNMSHFLHLVGNIL